MPPTTATTLSTPISSPSATTVPTTANPPAAASTASAKTTKVYRNTSCSKTLVQRGRNLHRKPTGKSRI